MNRIGFVVFALLVTFTTGCPKNVVTTVAGSDDQQMDQYTAQLEEYRTKTGLSCDESCAAKKKVCGISSGACELSTKAPERQDFQKTCVASQEECAKFSESCANCAK